ncbi:MAG: hypothetical protein WAL95_08965 [Candidatus Acidiferrales bacterium]
MHSITMGALLALQCFEVLFLLLHDWIPLGPLNDLKGVSTADSFGKRVATTLISAAPFAVGLAASILYFGQHFPDWLFWWLWISYGILFYGILQAWWIPYLFRAEPERSARYKIMFGATHALLPERNGIRVNTLHVIFHAATVALLIAVAVVSAQQGWPGSR